MTITRAVAVVGDETTILERLETLKGVLAPDLSRSELELFALVCASRGLDPFTRQIYASKRQGRVTFQTGIDGFRSLAERTGEYDGQDEPEYGPECGCGELPKGHPVSARVAVYRRGMSRPITFTALWHEYKPPAGAEGKGDAMWRKMPRLMLGKCAESGALRKAFPQVYGGIYSDVEMQRADAEEAATVAEPVGLKDRLRARREPVVVVEARAEAIVEAPTVAEIEAIADEILDAEIVEQPAPMARGAFNAAAVASHVTKADVAAARERLGIAADDQSDEAYGRLADYLGLRR